MKLFSKFFIENNGLVLSTRLATQLRFLLSLLLAGIASGLWAGELTQEMIETRIKPPLRVLPRLPGVPAWPLKHDFDTQADGGPYGYVFESIDLAPLPGFDGTPLNLLVAIDRKGTFIGVEVISQHEPMFRGGIGEAPLHQFVTQYASRNLTDQIIVASAGNRVGPKQTSKGQVVLDGVAQATASIRIVNQSVLTAALSVARARLGFSAQSTALPPATPDMTHYEKLDFQGMVEKGLIGRMRLSNAQVEALFAGTSAAGLDGDVRDHPDETFVELYLAYLNSPTTGRAILGDARYADVMKRNYANRHLWWVGVTGRYPLYDDRFVPASVPPRLSLRQDGLPYELRDVDFRDPDYNPPSIPGAPNITSSLVMHSITEGGVDPGRPLSLDLNIVREHGGVMRETTQKTAILDFTPASHLFVYPPKPAPEWLESWRQRIPELSIISMALAVLCGVLTAQRWSAISRARLRLIRLGFLAFTLAYIGWYAQGQLSIVQVNGLLRALIAGRGLSSFLYDPVTLLLIAFTLVSFFIWGRGTFCGWLCPFGAMQEFVGLAARAMHLPRLRLAARTARRLGVLRHVVLAVIVVAAFIAPREADTLAEIEPFKTAITTGFDRTWPYLGYAGLLLLAGVLYYKAFCRFLCPLGAVMSLGGKLRLLNWLPRRSECGTPCQRCKHHCMYDAIEDNGAIRYDDCFQCLDCVGIYHDSKRCAPIILYQRKNKVMTPQGAMDKDGPTKHA